MKINEERCVYLLIWTDGYSIEHTKYLTFEAAQKALRDEWNEYYDEEIADEWKKLSSITDSNAILYNNGEDVYVWDIAEISI